MKKEVFLNNNTAFGRKITTKERGHAFSDVVFLFPGASYLQGVLHSSSLPDYIEDKKSGGQRTDRQNKSLCNDPTIIIGREACKRPDAKNRNIVTLIGTLN